MRSRRIVHRPRRGMDESRFHTYRWRRVYRRATDECAVPPLDIGVWAMQLSPYRVGVAGPCHTRLLTSPAFRPCCCSLALSGLGKAVASESSALNSGLLRRQFAPCVTWRTVSLHAAQALRTLLAERGRATANTWLWPHLHHTRLEPRHRPPVGECTSQCRHCRHLPSLLTRLAKLSGDARPDGRQRAFAQGDIARGLNPYPPHYRMAFASSLLPLPHVYRLALRLTFPRGRRTGLPCSVSVTTNGVGALCPPVALLPMTRKRGLLVPATVPFWLKPASTLGLFSVTMFIEHSPGFALPSILAPSPS